MNVVDSSGELLMYATECAKDGDISNAEQKEMQILIDKVQVNLKSLCEAFDGIRREHFLESPMELPLAPRT